MPKGKARPLSPEELDRAAEISDRDIERAQRAWKHDAPPRFKKLLDTPAEEKE